MSDQPGLEPFLTVLLFHGIEGLGDAVREEEQTVAGEDQIVHMIDNFSRAALEKRTITPPPEEAVRTLRVLDALAQSARQDRVVKL